MSHTMNCIPAPKADNNTDVAQAGWRAKAGAFMRSPMQTLLAVTLGASLLATAGALNGGTLPPASAFTPLKVWLQTNFLGSDWVLLMGFVALIALIWGLVHGKGWGAASIVLGLMTAALLGPTMVVACATATRAPAPIVQQLHQLPPAAPAATIFFVSPSATATAHV